MTSQDYGLARRMWHQLEPVHAVFWYAPQVFDEAAGPACPIASTAARSSAGRRSP